MSRIHEGAYPWNPRHLPHFGSEFSRMLRNSGLFSLIFLHRISTKWQIVEGQLLPFDQLGDLWTLIGQCFPRRYGERTAASDSKRVEEREVRQPIALQPIRQSEGWLHRATTLLLCPVVFKGSGALLHFITLLSIVKPVDCSQRE